MAAVDDQRLIELSAEPAGELFTLLKRPHAFWPLLVLLAVLPGVYALEYRALQPEGALWGMRSLNVYVSQDADDFLDPGGVTEERLLRWRSPLTSWLTALFLWLLGPSEPLAMVVVSYLATAGIVALGYTFGDWLAGPRCGFWAALLLAFHGTLLVQAQTPAPHSLAIVLGMLAFLGFLRHVDSTTGLFSPALLLGATALGLCLLASGPMAFAVATALTLSIAGWRGTRTLPRRSPGEEPRRVWVGRDALKSLLVLVLLAAVVGGWWPAFMAYQHGPEFWYAWLLNASDASALGSSDPSPFLSALLASTHDAFGPLIGLVLLGLWVAARAAMQTSVETERRRFRFVIAWALIAAVSWIALFRSATAPDSVPQLWRGFLLVPSALLAAVAVEFTAQRRVWLVAVVAAACFTALAALWPSLASVFEQSDRSTAVAVTIISVVSVVLAAAWLIQHSEGRDFQKRLILGTLLLALAAGNAVRGLAASTRAGPEERALAGMRAELEEVDNVRSWIIVGEPPIPLQLRLALRSLWPHASRDVVETWDSAIAQALSTPLEPAERIVAVDWSTRDTRPTRIQVPELQIAPLTRSRFFHTKQLTAYELRAAAADRLDPDRRRVSRIIRNAPLSAR